MSGIGTARDRAEDLLQTLQKKGREVIEAEERLVKTVRDLMEEKSFSPAEVKNSLEELLGRIRGNRVWEKVRASDAVVALSDYRDEVEKKVEDSVQRILGSLQIASKNDLQAISKQIKALNKKFNDLNKKLNDGS